MGLQQYHASRRGKNGLKSFPAIKNEGAYRSGEGVEEPAFVKLEPRTSREGSQPTLEGAADSKNFLSSQQHEEQLNISE